MREGHAPKGMLREKNCVQAAAAARPTTVAMPMAPPVGLTGARTPMLPVTRVVSCSPIWL